MKKTKCQLCKEKMRMSTDKRKNRNTRGRRRVAVTDVGFFSLNGNRPPNQKKADKSLAMSRPILVRYGYHSCRVRQVYITI